MRSYTNASDVHNGSKYRHDGPEPAAVSTYCRRKKPGRSLHDSHMGRTAFAIPRERNVTAVSSALDEIAYVFSPILHEGQTGEPW